MSPSACHSESAVGGEGELPGLWGLKLRGGSPSSGAGWGKRDGAGIGGVNMCLGNAEILITGEV